MKQLNHLTVKSVVIATVLVVTLVLASIVTAHKQSAPNSTGVKPIAVQPNTVRPLSGSANQTTGNITDNAETSQQQTTTKHPYNPHSPIEASGKGCDWQYDKRSFLTMEDVNSTNEEYFGVINIPEQVVTEMSTVCLLDKVLGFPKWFLLSSRNSDQEGFAFIRKHFHALDALLERSDSGPVLLEAYQNFDLSDFGKLTDWSKKMTNEERFAGGQSKPDILRRMELMLGQPEVIASLNREQKIALLEVLSYRRGFKQQVEYVTKVTSSIDVESIAITAARVMLSMPEVNFQQWIDQRPQVDSFLKSYQPPPYEALDSIMNAANDVVNRRPVSQETFQGLLSVSKLFGLSDELFGRLGLSSVHLAVTTLPCESYSGYTSVSIYTPKGSLLQDTCKCVADLSDSQIAAYNSQIPSQFPNATFISSSTRRYNCHSYAWNNQTITNDIWIGMAPRTTAENAYWTDGSYFVKGTQPINPATTAYAVSLPDATNHSLRTVSKSDLTTFVSKWGPGPVMRHPLSANTPYGYLNAGSMTYYDLTMPDFTTTTLSSSVTGVVGGTLTNLSVSYANLTASTTSAARVGFYYTTSPNDSANAVFSGYSCTLRSGALANLVYTCTGSVGIPSNLATGSYYLKAYIDDQRAVPESNEGNNTRYFGPITITTPQAAKPNLIISGLVASAGGNAGVSSNHSVTVLNNGTASAGSFRVGVYLATANNGTLGTLVGSGTIGGLGIGISSTVNISVLYPNWPSGSYYMQIYVDDQSQISEFNENDNILVKGWVNLNNVVTNPISWEFSISGNADGWGFQNLAAWNVSGGILFLDPNNGDYFMYRNTSFTAGSYRKVHIRLASNGTDNVGAVYFKTANENYYSEDKKLLFNVSNCSLCGNAGFYEYYVSTSHGKWNGTITGLRLDPSGTGVAGTNRDSIGLDFIRVEP